MSDGPRIPLDKAEAFALALFQRRLGYASIEDAAAQGEHVEVHTVDPKGGDPSEWPADLRVRQFPEVGE